MPVYIIELLLPGGWHPAPLFGGRYFLSRDAGYEEVRRSPHVLKSETYRVVPYSRDAEYDD